ncbi:MAG: hypothetical protein WBG48_06925 [Pricia sp.]
MEKTPHTKFHGRGMVIVNKVNKKLFLLFNGIVMSLNVLAQKPVMTQSEENLLSSNLIGMNIAKLEEHFDKMNFKKAQELSLSQKYNYLYSSGLKLLYLGKEVERFALKVKDERVVETHFEISFSNKKKIFERLIALHGYPDSGNINPENFPQLKNPEKGRKKPDNYLFENYSGLVWIDEDTDIYMSVTNLANTEYFIGKTFTLWISYRIAKD